MHFRCDVRICVLDSQLHFHRCLVYLHGTIFKHIVFICKIFQVVEILYSGYLTQITASLCVRTHRSGLISSAGFWFVIFCSVKFTGICYTFGVLVYKVWLRWTVFFQEELFLKSAVLLCVHEAVDSQINLTQTHKQDQRLARALASLPKIFALLGGKKLLLGA